jgi:hypothetical protein
MHDRREREAERLRKSKTLTCDCCNEEFPTKSKGRYVEEYFSPLIAGKASGILTICPKCAEENEEKYGQPFGQEGEESGYFICTDCEKLQQYGHSWEIYATVDENGYHCMKCMGERCMAPDSEAWLDKTTDIDAFVQDNEALREKVKHLTCIAGAKELPGGCIDFRESVEYKTEKLSWFSTMDFGGWGDTEKARRELSVSIRTVLKFYRRCVVYLAEASQFNTYLSIAVHPRDRKKSRA